MESGTLTSFVPSTLGTDTLQTLALELIVGAYPLLLMVVSYFLMKLYERKFRLLWEAFFGLFQENWHR